jgi:hypothetical protein
MAQTKINISNKYYILESHITRSWYREIRWDKMLTVVRQYPRTMWIKGYFHFEHAVCH